VPATYHSASQCAETDPHRAAAGELSASPVPLTVLGTDYQCAGWRRVAMCGRRLGVTNKIEASAVKQGPITRR
jgi:hypothetical protein